jgi:hypothetical protein
MVLTHLNYVEEYAGHELCREGDRDQGEHSGLGYNSDSVNENGEDKRGSANDKENLKIQRAIEPTELVPQKLQVVATKHVERIGSDGRNKRDQIE